MLAVRDSRTFPAGGGELGALIRAFDWSRTPLGPIAGWPQSLKTAVDIVLRSPVPLVMLWGARRHHDLQRCLLGLCRRASPPAARLQGAGGLARGGRPQPPGDGGGPARRDAVFPRRAPRPLSPRPARRTSGSTSTTAPCSTKAASRPACWRSWSRRPSGCGPRRRCATARRSSAPLPRPCRNHVWSATPDGRLDWFNHQVLEYTGAEARARSMGDGWGEVVHPDDLERAVAAWQKALARRHGLRDRVSPSPKRRRLPLAPGPRHADPRRGRPGRALDRHQHRHRRSDPRRARLARPRGRPRPRAADRQGRRRRGRSHRRLPQPALAGISRHPWPAAGCRQRDRTRIGCGASIPRIANRPSSSSSTPSRAASRDYNAEYRIVRPSDGQVRWIAVKAEIERDAEGRAAASGRRPHRHHRQQARRAGRPRKRGALPPRLGKRPGHAVDGRRARQVPLPQPDAARLLGRRAETTLPASTGTRRCIPTIAQALFAVFGQAMRDHAPFTVEARYRRADGEYRLMRTDAQPRFGAGGDFLGMIGVNVDITETRRAEQALKESEERFRLIANSAPVPMWVSRLDGKRAFVNQAYMEFLGLGYEDCLVFDWRKALHPDDLQRILREQIAGEGSRQAVRARGPLSARRRPVALAAVGVAAPLGPGRRARRLHRRRPRHHRGQARRDRAARPERDARGPGRGAHARARPHLERVAGPAGGRRRATASGSTSIPPPRRCSAGARPSCWARRRNGSSIPTTSPIREPSWRTWRPAAGRSASRTACATRTAPIAGCPGRRRRTRA